MASQYAELGKQNNTQFNYVLPSGEVIPAGINPDKAATVDLKGVLQGTVASNVPQAILDLAKQQYTPTRMAVANTDLRTASGEIIKAGSEFDIMGKGSLTPVDAMSAKGAYWTETGKSGSDYVTPSPNAAPNVFNAPPASPETQKANVLTATGTTQEQLNANEAANLKYTPTPQNVNIPGNKQMTAGEIGAGLDTAKQEALAIQAKLAEMKKLDTEANAEAEKEATALSDTNVDLSDSSKLIAALTKTIGGTEAPTPTSQVDLFNQKWKESGADAMQTDLANIDSQIEEVNTNLLVEAEKAGERLVSMGQITKRRGKLQMEAEQRIALLTVQRNSIARQLDNKLNTINTIMKLTQQDYANSVDAYNSQFNKSLQLINLFKGIQDDEKTHAEANLNTIINLAHSSGKTWNDMTPDMQRQIMNLESQQGLPVGTTQAFMNTKPGAEVLNKTVITDANGNQFTQIVYKDPKTGMSGTVEMIPAGVSDKATDKDKKNNEMLENFRKDLTDYVKQTDDYGKVITREQFIRMLQAKYPQIESSDIEKMVYQTYPDNWEK